MKYFLSQKLAKTRTNTTVIKHFFSKTPHWARFALGIVLCTALYSTTADKRLVSLGLADYFPIHGVDQSENIISNPRQLFDFSEKLGQLRINQVKKVRIFHFHDAAQTEQLGAYLGDRFQAAFGAGGLGYFTSKQFSQSEESSEDTQAVWSTRTLDHGSRVGLSANTMISKAPSATIRIATNETVLRQNRTFSKVTVFHHNKLNSVEFGLDVPSQDNIMLPSYAGEMSSVFILDKNTPQADLKIKSTSGNGFNIDGILLEKVEKGVVYNDIPLVSASFKEMAAARYLTRQLGEQFPDLIILTLGYEEAKQAKFERKTFEKAVLKVINDFHTDCPGASILITTPFVSDAEFALFPNIEHVNQSLRNLVKDNNLSIWDAQHIVDSSVVSQKEEGALQGKLLFRALIQNFNKVVQLLP